MVGHLRGSAQGSEIELTVDLSGHSVSISIHGNAPVQSSLPSSMRGKALRPWVRMGMVGDAITLLDVRD